MDLRRTPLGYAQTTTLSSAVPLANAIPAGANLAVVVAEAQDVRWRDDGTAPTATVGVPLAKGAVLEYTGTLSAIQFFEQAGGAKLNVAFYKIAG